MSAPHIPNLLDSLRSARGARSARGRGRGGGPSRSAVSQDATIQGTDTDAAVSRLSAVDLGYLDDPYAPFFVQSADGPAPRRLPIINRGTYARTTALDRIVDAFLASGEGPENGPRERQIVSLGAGTDTRPFRLFAQPARTGLIYHEIDFEVTSSKKFRTVQANPVLRGILGDASREESTSSWSSRPPTGGEYYCHGFDLRLLAAPLAAQTEAPTNPDADAEPAEEARGEVTVPGLRSDTPTLLISECCLCYLSPSDASGVLAYFTSRIPELSTVIYEPIRPQDAFGRMMVSNLAQRRIRMPTLEAYHEPRDQEVRLRAASFEQVEHMTIRAVWEKWVPADEKERVDFLEGLDEVEEWHLLADHYIVIWASKGAMPGRWARIGQGISGTG